MDISKLTIGEIATVEDMSGLPIAALGEDDKPKGRLMVALAFVINKRSNPNYKKSEAEALTMDEMTSLLGMTEEEEKLGK